MAACLIMFAAARSRASTGKSRQRPLVAGCQHSNSRSLWTCQPPKDSCLDHIAVPFSPSAETSSSGHGELIQSMSNSAQEQPDPGVLVRHGFTSCLPEQGASSLLANIPRCPVHLESLAWVSSMKTLRASRALKSNYNNRRGSTAKHAAQGSCYMEGRGRLPQLQLKK
eukprot:1159344-Pelagomonas_calceolata.AAC.4